MMMGGIEDALERLDCLVPRSVVVRSAPMVRANQGRITPVGVCQHVFYGGLENDVLIIVT
jgi:hypothetical protein